MIEAEPERVKAIIAALREGQYLQHAADLAKLNYHTVEAWMKRGQADVEQDATTPYSAFYTDVRAAQAEWVKDRLQRIQRAGEKDWKADAALLGRRHRGLWSEQNSQGESAPHAMQINIGIALPGVANTTQVIDTTAVTLPSLDDE